MLPVRLSPCPWPCPQFRRRVRTPRELCLPGSGMHRCWRAPFLAQRTAACAWSCALLRRGETTVCAGQHARTRVRLCLSLCGVCARTCPSRPYILALAHARSRARSHAHARSHARAGRAHALCAHTLARSHVNTEVVARRHVQIRLLDEVILERRIRPDLIGARLLPPGCASLAACRCPVTSTTLSLTCIVAHAATGQDLVAEASIVSHLEGIRTAVVEPNGHAVDFLRDKAQQASSDGSILLWARGNTNLRV